MASAEVRRAWTERYAGQVSIIASQMAGRPICRPADLRMLTTTSLYGMSSSQYNRLKLRRADHPKLGRDIIWQELEHTTGGYGTVHLGPETVRALRELAQEKHQAKRINHIFGEGTSPRLRQVRGNLVASSSQLSISRRGMLRPERVLRVPTTGDEFLGCPAFLAG